MAGTGPERPGRALGEVPALTTRDGTAVRHTLTTLGVALLDVVTTPE